MPLDPSTLKIDLYPTEVLRTKADPVELTDETRAVALRMIDLMHSAEGIGLAAPQVGLTWRLFVVHVPHNRDDEDTPPNPDLPSTCAEPLVFFNPEITETSKDLEPLEEGCLSLPGINGEVRRPSTITVRATDLNNNTFELKATGLLARCIQHENDHLDGVLIIDKMPQLARMKNRTKIKALEKSAKRR